MTVRPPTAWLSRRPAALRGLVVLRWAQIVAECGAIAVGALWALPQAPPTWIVVCVAVAALSNVALDRARSTSWGEQAAGAAVLLDVAALTALLATTGGASNPFRAAYLVEIVVAATLLRPAAVVAVVLACLVGDGVLMVLPSDDPHAVHMRGHLLGMWGALALVGPFVAWAIGYFRAALDRSDAALQIARDERERLDRLAGLATLAAGAAHELATPLSTIAVAASELERRTRDADPRLADDARVVREEVARCRDILAHLADDAGAGIGERVGATPFEQVLEAATRGLAHPERLVIDVADEVLDLPAPGSPRTFARVLRNLVDNARRASPGGAEVALRAGLDERAWWVSVVDHGLGMSEDVALRAREPFFTTRPAGQGMGLGLFVADRFAEQAGGRLDVDTAPGRGTTVTLRFPRTHE